jgi:hypothetical protein
MIIFTAIFAFHFSCSFKLHSDAQSYPFVKLGAVAAPEFPNPGFSHANPKMECLTFIYFLIYVAYIPFCPAVLATMCSVNISETLDAISPSRFG